MDLFVGLAHKAVGDHAPPCTRRSISRSASPSRSRWAGSCWRSASARGSLSCSRRCSAARPRSSISRASCTTSFPLRRCFASRSRCSPCRAHPGARGPPLARLLLCLRADRVHPHDLPPRLDRRDAGLRARVPAALVPRDPRRLRAPVRAGRRALREEPGAVRLLRHELVVRLQPRDRDHRAHGSRRARALDRGGQAAPRVRSPALQRGARVQALRRSASRDRHSGARPQDTRERPAQLQPLRVHRDLEAAHAGRSRRHARAWWD